MAQTLTQRQTGYEDSYRQKIISRIPVVIKIDGRSFSKVTLNKQKPFCYKTMAMLNGTMLSMAKQIDGAVFGYQYSDKIILILKNDRSPDEDAWFGNDVQMLSSVSSSMATYEFMNQLWENENPPDLNGKIVFRSHVFGVPNITETINYLIYKQYHCMQKGITDAVFSVLAPRYGKDVSSMLEDKNLEDRKKILDESGFSWEALPGAFRMGSAVYLVPRLIDTVHGQVTQHKWVLDFNLPMFTEEREWLRTILTTGSDIFRPERDLNDALQGSG